MKRILAIAALAAAAAACSAAAQDADALAPASAVAAPAVERATLSCDINMRRTAGGVIIQAVAASDRDFDGGYDLQISKSGPNTAALRQGGPLALAAGASATLGENEITLGRGEHLRAVLILSAAGAELCRRDIGL